MTAQLATNGERAMDDRAVALRIAEAPGGANANCPCAMKLHSRPTDDGCSRRHREDFGYTVRAGAALGPYSSAISFAGWTRRFAMPASYDPLPVSPPRTSLLKFDWSEYGRIDPFECPGSLW